MSTVTELGYLGISVSDLERWKAFACAVVGMEWFDEGEGDRVYLRMDEWHHRLILHPDGGDDVAYVGWRVAGPNDLAAIAGKLEQAGYEFRHATREEAAERRVMGLLKLVDPAGINTEIFWGPRIDAHKPFHPGRPMFGRFLTGEQGAGHIVLSEPDMEAAVRFYELLGFEGAAEYIFTFPDGMQVAPVFMHVNGRQHSLAFVPGSPTGKAIGHFMAQYTELKDLGLGYDLMRQKKFDIAIQLGMHSNDQMFSFYAGSPSKWPWEIGWGGIPASNLEAYHTRDVFGHAVEVPGYGLEVPMDGGPSDE